MLRIIALSLLMCLSGCWFERGPGIPPGASIITVGDSILAWNRWDDSAIADVVGDDLDRVVYNPAAPGATVLGGGGSIPSQYASRHEWDWMIVDGGINDAASRCECSSCYAVLDQVITPGGTAGALPDLVDRATAQGARVVVFGYYHLPDTTEEDYARCNPVIDLLNRRYALLAAARDRVWFVNGTDVFTPDEIDHYADDHLHPSARGSRAIGRAIAARIREVEETNREQSRFLLRDVRTTVRSTP